MSDETKKSEKLNEKTAAAVDKAGQDLLENVWAPEFFRKCAQLGVTVTEEDAPEMLTIVDGIRQVKSANNMSLDEPMPVRDEGSADEPPSMIKSAAYGLNDLLGGGRVAPEDPEKVAAAYADRVDLSALFNTAEE